MARGCARSTTSISSLEATDDIEQLDAAEVLAGIAVEIAAGGDGGGVLEATLVEQQHDRLDLALLQDRDERVDSVRLVEEVEPGDARRGDDKRRALSVSPMNAIFSPVDVFTIRYGGRSGFPRARISPVRREVLGTEP